MARRTHAGVRLGRGAVAALALLTMLACDDDIPGPAPEAPAKEEKPWIPVGIKAALDAYPLTEKAGLEHCGMLCQRADKQVFATGPIPGTDRDCIPWNAPCPAGVTAIGTYHTHNIGPLNEANPRRPFSPPDLRGEEPYDFIAQALTPRTKSGLDVHIYMFEKGIQTECQVHPTVICPFPPIPTGKKP